MTKKKILSQTAQLFDPIGYAAPVVIRAKIGLQKSWQKGYEWDQLLNQTEDQEWRAFFKELKELNEQAIS